MTRGSPIRVGQSNSRIRARVRGRREPESALGSGLHDSRQSRVASATRRNSCRASAGFASNKPRQASASPPLLRHTRWTQPASGSASTLDMRCLQARSSWCGKASGEVESLSSWFESKTWHDWYLSALVSCDAILLSASSWERDGFRLRSRWVAMPRGTETIQISSTRSCQPSN